MVMYIVQKQIDVKKKMKPKREKPGTNEESEDQSNEWNRCYQW